MKRYQKDISVLAFDTSSALFTAAISARGKTFSIDTTDKRASEALFVSLDRLIKTARWDYKKIDLIAVGVGPGSFTGLRVGVMAAKTMAYALQIKLAGLSTLEIIASNMMNQGPVGVAMNAGRGNVYTACYGLKKALRIPRLMSTLSFSKSMIKGVHYIGSAVSEGCDVLDWKVRARNMIPISLERWSRGDFDNPFCLEPEYLYERTCSIRK